MFGAACLALLLLLPSTAGLMRPHALNQHSCRLFCSSAREFRCLFGLAWVNLFPSTRQTIPQCGETCNLPCNHYFPIEKLTVSFASTKLPIVVSRTASLSGNWFELTLYIEVESFLPSTLYLMEIAGRSYAPISPI